MSEEAAPAAAPEAAPAPPPEAGSPAPDAAPAAAPSGGEAPSAQEAGDGVAEAMQEQGVSDPNDLDWSRTVTVTVDGQERTVPLSELRGNYELRRSSFERFEEAKKLREATEGEKQRLTEILGALRDPSMAPAVLRELGMAPDQLQAVQEALRAELEMPEDKRRMRELERREQQLREREKAYQQKRAQEQARREQAKFVQAFDSALDPHGLSGDKSARVLMAQYLDHRYPRQGSLSDQQLTQLATEAATYAAEELQSKRKQAVTSLAPGELAKLLTPEQVAALREQRVEEYRQGKAQPASKPASKPKKEPERKRINSLADFRAVLEGE